jgi:hypothetical protein
MPGPRCLVARPTLRLGSVHAANTSAFGNRCIPSCGVARWSPLGPGSPKRSEDGFAQPSRLNIAGVFALLAPCMMGALPFDMAPFDRLRTGRTGGFAQDRPPPPRCVNIFLGRNASPHFTLRWVGRARFHAVSLPSVLAFDRAAFDPSMVRLFDARPGTLSPRNFRLSGSKRFVGEKRAGVIPAAGYCSRPIWAFRTLRRQLARQGPSWEVRQATPQECLSG